MFSFLIAKTIDNTLIIFRNAFVCMLRNNSYVEIYNLSEEKYEYLFCL